MDGVQLAREPQLLADRRLAHRERFGDLTLRHPDRDNRSQGENASQSSDILLTTRIAVLGHQCHKDPYQGGTSRHSDREDETRAGGSPRDGTRTPERPLPSSLRPDCRARTNIEGVAALRERPKGQRTTSKIIETAGQSHNWRLAVVGRSRRFLVLVLPQCCPGQPGQDRNRRRANRPAASAPMVVHAWQTRVT